MKKSFLSFCLLLIGISTFSQTSKLEQNLTGVQIGVFGMDLYHETKLSEKFVLRAEASLFPAIWGGDLYDKTGFMFYPALTLQPKYYYNFAKRVENGKKTKNNSSNYLGLQVRYIPDWFVISNEDNINLSNQLNIIPTYGIRRNFSQDFNYEFKVGLGYGTTFGNDNNNSGAVLDLSFKVGYDF